MKLLGVLGGVLRVHGVAPSPPKKVERVTRLIMANITGIHIVLKENETLKKASR